MNRTSIFQRIAHAVAIAAVLGLGVPPSFAATTPTGTMGGGNCSVWQSIKSAATGVYCGYL